MKNNLYKNLPPLERKTDCSLYGMTPAQRKRANTLIRRECCNYDDGNCLVLDDGCPQIHSFSTKITPQPLKAGALPIYFIKQP